jgi:hypothetical protein
MHGWCGELISHNVRVYIIYTMFVYVDDIISNTLETRSQIGRGLLQEYVFTRHDISEKGIVRSRFCEQNVRFRIWNILYIYIYMCVCVCVGG